MGDLDRELRQFIGEQAAVADQMGAALQDWVWNNPTLAEEMNNELLRMVRDFATKYPEAVCDGLGAYSVDLHKVTDAAEMRALLVFNLASYGLKIATIAALEKKQGELDGDSL